uniref:CSON015142 protein n=1 Tax=Culicoides sonorensis TaxID=179676 RepID=A0A336MIA8_CULSO
MSYLDLPSKDLLPQNPSTSSSQNENDKTLDPNGFKLIANRIFVGGMSRETTEEDLLRYFAGYGNVKSAKIITDINTGVSKGYGFVTFASEDEALRLQKFAGIAILHNRKLNIGPAIKRNGSTTNVANAVASVMQANNTVTPTPMIGATHPTVQGQFKTSNVVSPMTPGNGLVPGLLDPATAAMLYQPFYGFPYSYLSYGGTQSYQFPF